MKARVFSIDLRLRIMKRPADLRVQPVQRVTLTDSVYKNLFEAIVTGAFAGGDELNEVSLSRQFSVSRTPVREALRLLAAEGLVDISSNRSATVRRISERDMSEIYQIRGVLEPLAASLAAERMPRGEARRLRERLERIAGELSGPDEGEPGFALRDVDFDCSFHAAIAGASGNRRLRDDILRHTNVIRLVPRLLAQTAERTRQVYEEHDRVLSALEAKDAEAARRAMEAHVASATQWLETEGQRLFRVRDEAAAAT